jgi:hypothetical protein
MGGRTTDRASGSRSGRRWVGSALSNRLLGPGASRGEVGLALGAAATAAVALPALAWRAGVEWSALRWGVAALLAADLVGGVVVNASSPARRYYFRAGRTTRHHLGFVALHTVHVVVFAWLFAGGSWLVALALSGLLLGGAVLIRSSPVHLRRPVALLGVLIPLAALSGGSIAPGMEWFVPVLLLKLFVSYLLGDVPAATSPAARAQRHTIPSGSSRSIVHASPQPDTPP